MHIRPHGAVPRRFLGITSEVFPISASYYLELHNAITSYLGVQ